MTADLQLSPVVESHQAQVGPPPMYQVVLLNDDYTPMDFVIMILQKFFAKTDEEATHIMLRVHHEGRGTCGVFSRDIASTKVSQVVRCARASQHPLQCIMETV